MLNNKKNAFTLVELLVVIVILGIITGISIPLIRNVQISQQRKQYETYRNSLSYASKVYADSFSEDLFGHDEIACATVTYNQLKSKNLIKDIPISGVSCASSDTFVRIVKFEDQYSYLPKITCGVPQTGGTISKDVEIPEGSVDSEFCGLNVDTKIDIIFNPESSHTPNVQRKNINVEFKSPTGIHSDPIIYWAFSDKADFSSIIGEWKQLDIDVPSKKKQKAQILQGSTISLTKEFITPKNYSGKLYLVLKIDRLQDLGGKNWTNTDTEVVSGGYYAVDNEPPKLNGSEIKYSKPVHRQVTPTLNFKATDNLTSESNLRMCISEDTATDTCSKNIMHIKNKTHNWVKYEKNKVLPVMNNASNGENHNIFISIGDQAGNYVTQQFIYYQSPVDYSITYNLDGGTHGTSHPSRVDFDEEFTVNYPTKKIKTIFKNTITGVSIDYSASTISGSGKFVNYTFNGWNISGMDNSTHTFGSRTSNNTQEKNVKETKFKGLRHTSLGVLFTATWTPPIITLPKANKTGYICKWTSPPSYEWASGGKYTPETVGGVTERTFTTSCLPNLFTVAYDINGGTSGFTSSHTCTYDAACRAKANGFTKTGYSFTGWRKNNTGSIVAAGASIKNAATSGTVTYYAQWKANDFTVAYNKNGGTGTTSSHTCTYDAACSAKPNGFTRTGHVFNGWKKNNEGNIVAEGASIKNAVGSGTVTYWAQWKANTFTVEYNANGGSGSTSSHTCTYDAACSAKSNGFTKTGYSFNGWKKNNTGSIVAAGASIKNAATSGTVTYYAQWGVNTFTVKYKGNNANHGSMSDTTCTYDSDCSLRANTFTRLGYTFLGWSTSSSATSATYVNQGSIKNAITSGTLNLYAVWKKNKWKVSSPEGGADTFAAALSKANNNATLTLTESYTDSSMPDTTKSKVFVDLGGYTLSTTQCTTIKSGHAMEIKNGTLTCTTTTFKVLGTLDIKSGTYSTTIRAGHVVSVGSKTISGGNLRMTGGKLTTSTVSGHSTLIVEYGGMASIENATVENKAANGSAVTIKDNAYKVYFKNNAIISASHDQAIYIGQGSNIFVYALKGSTITGTSHSIGITQGYLCLSNQTTLKSSTASGDASVYVASPGKMMGVNKGKCKDNL